MHATLIDRLLGSDIPYITYAVPFFFVLIALELVVGWRQRREHYRFNDSINDLSCGIIDQVLRVFLETILFTGYLFIYSHCRLMKVENFSPAGKWAAAGALVLGVDFCFYWFHRFAHERAAPWATHVVHHQSEEYNLTVALRQSALESCFAWVFYLPLALLGFPPLWYLAMSSINLLYQFWIHTEVIGRLGPLEWVLNTPSHHRVHHARNPKYLDKNYAGMLIIWDRLFSTFQPEEEPPVYGLTKPLHSWNPLWANLHMWVDLARTARRAPRWQDKVKVWFMPLGWTPPGLEPKPPAQEVTRETLVKFDPRLPLGMNLYIVFHFAVAMALGLVVLVGADEGAARGELVWPATALFWTLASLGGLFERRRWAAVSEVARLLAFSAAAIVYAGTTSYILPLDAGVGAALIGSLACLVRYRQLFMSDMAAQSLLREVTT